MDPPARDSVKRVSPQLWTLGSRFICSRAVAGETSPSSVVSWTDGDSVFSIQPRDEKSLVSEDRADSAIDRIQECGTGGSLWRLGDEAICKVKSWSDNRQLEAATIEFVVNNCPDVPVPEVLYSWVDQSLNRTYLILKRVHARTLDSAWPRLSSDQKLKIAARMAQHCSKLAENTSRLYQTASGSGVLEYCLMARPPASNPSWLPMTLGPLSFKEMQTYMKKISEENAPDFKEPFVFYHPDLGPTNIMISDDGNDVHSIIDWEAAAFFPRFWVATKPPHSPAFRLAEQGDRDE